MTLINAIIAFYLRSRSSNRSRLILSCSTIRQQPLLCTVPSPGMDPTAHSPEKHLHRGFRVCSSPCPSQHQCLHGEPPPCPHCHGRSVSAHFLCPFNQSPTNTCDHPDASVCPLVALASTPHLFHSRWSKTLQQLMLPKTLPCDCDNCSLALATEICLSPPVCI